MFGSKKSKPSSGGRYDTLIARGTELKGNVTFSGGLHIDGRVEGEIKSDPENTGAIVRISEAGEVHGNVIAPHVVINGKVNGDVYSSEHVELAAKASITGNVYYNLIEMAMGAEVNGSLVHQKDAEAQHKTTSAQSGKSSAIATASSGATASGSGAPEKDDKETRKDDNPVTKAVASGANS